MKRLLLVIFLTIIAPSVSASPQRRAGDTADAASCRKFVGEFYAWYLAHGKNADPLAAAVRQKKANFSHDLLQRLREDRAAAEKSPNEIVGLDFDPVLNGQDFAEKYITGKVTQKGGRFFVEVFSVYGGKKSEGPAVTPELRNEGGVWVFTNFHYSVDGKSDDLLGILKRMKADRKKHK